MRVGGGIGRYSITSLIRVLLSGKSKGVIEERCDKSKGRLINYMHVQKGQSGLLVLHLTAGIWKTSSNKKFIHKKVSESHKITFYKV